MSPRGLWENDVLPVLMYHFGGINHENADTLRLWQVRQLMDMLETINEGTK